VRNLREQLSPELFLNNNNNNNNNNKKKTKRKPMAMYSTRPLSTLKRVRNSEGERENLR